MKIEKFFFVKAVDAYFDDDSLYKFLFAVFLSSIIYQIIITYFNLCAASFILNIIFVIMINFATTMLYVVLLDAMKVNIKPYQMLPLSISLYTPVLLLDLLLLPIILMMGGFGNNLDKLLNGNIVKKLIEPHVLDGSFNKITKPVAVTIIYEFVRDQIGRSLRGHSGSSEDISSESVTVGEVVQEDDFAFISFTVSTVEQSDSKTSYDKGVFFMKIQLDNSNENLCRTIIHIKNVYFFGKDRSDIDIVRSFKSFVGSNSEDFLVNSTGLDEDLLSKLDEVLRPSTMSKANQNQKSMQAE